MTHWPHFLRIKGTFSSNYEVNKHLLEGALYSANQGSQHKKQLASQVRFAESPGGMERGRNLLTQPGASKHEAKAITSCLSLKG